MPYILALDQGTTSSRALLFEYDSNTVGSWRICAQAQQELTQYFPQPGWVEHDPAEIWRTQLDTARRVLAIAGVEPQHVAALGLTNQRETVVLWDRRTGQPVHRAIVWQDRRTSAVCERLRAEGLESWLREKTGLVPDPYFSATKIAWILDRQPGLRARAAAGELCVGTVDSWLMWNLTGGAVHATDVSNASRTLLMNLHTGAWDPELLKLFDIPAALLPTIGPSSGPIGHTLPTLFGASIPMTGVAGDQQAALFGQGCLNPGMAKNTYGTGCFLLLQTGQHAPLSRHGLLTTVAWRLGAQPLQYALEGAVFIAGAAVQWLRDQLGIIRAAGEIEALAAQVSDSAGVHFVPAFTGLGAPWWDPAARGTITGLTRGVSKAHLARATLEAIAFQTGDVVAAMAGDAGKPLTELRVDGGAATNNLLMQIQADQLGVPVIRPTIIESTALGAAMLAAYGIGLMPSTAAATSIGGTRFESTLSLADRAARQAAWHAAVRRARSHPD